MTPRLELSCTTNSPLPPLTTTEFFSFQEGWLVEAGWDWSFFESGGDKQSYGYDGLAKSSVGGYDISVYKKGAQDRIFYLVVIEYVINYYPNGYGEVCGFNLLQLLHHIELHPNKTILELKRSIYEALHMADI